MKNKVKNKKKVEFITIYEYAKRNNLSTQVVYARGSELPINLDGKIKEDYVWHWKKAGRKPNSVKK